MNMNRPIFLRGRKTVLRPLSKADVPLLLRWSNDPDVRVFLNRVFPASEPEEMEWVESLTNSTDNIVLMVETKDGTPIGTMGLHRINWQDRIAVTGAAFGEKAYWGKGYGQDAKMALLEYAFHTLNLRKICSSCFAFNRRSAAYSLRCGYRVEGRRKRQVHRKGRYYDEILMAIFREAFEAKWKTYRRTGRL